MAGSSFQYDPDYLADAARYEISPDLKLVPTRSYTAENQTLFGAFEDASPDQWGEKIIEANHAVLSKTNPHLPRRLGQFDFLLGVSDRSRMGALRFKRITGGDWLSNESAVANVHDIKRVLGAAGRYEANRATDEDVAYLSNIATSPGGARPKANIETDSGHLAIAKLPHSKDGSIDVEGWEAVALTLAKNAGIHTPRFELLAAAKDKSVLLVRRFDRSHENFRIGYISAATAMGIGKHDDARRTYEEFADTIAEVSASARADLREMYRRIALTVLVNNADDHWRNHGFLRGPTGWRLSPVFDVNPSAQHGSINSRRINDRDDPRDRDIRNLVDIADSYQLSRGEGASIIRDIALEVENWPTVAKKLGLSKEQQSAMSRAFDERQLEAAKDLAAPGPTATTEISAPASTATSVWVRPHVRNGDDVEGHWRARRGQQKAGPSR